MNKKYGIILLLSIAVIVLLYSIAGGGSRSDLDIGEDSLSVSYKDFSASVEYKDVEAIEQVEVSDFGSVVTGGSDKVCRWGLWENEDWGEYTQYSLVGTSNGILLHLRDGGKVLLSYESGETTVLLGQLLFDMLSEHGYEASYIE